MKGGAWGVPSRATADLVVEGSDSELASWVAQRPGALIRFSATRGSDLGAAVGLTSPNTSTIHDSGYVDTGGAGIEAPLDAIRLADGTVAVNMVVLGAAPDHLGRLTRRRQVEVLVDGERMFSGRASTVVIATGQYLRGRDVVPRGHPGDGHLEVQVYRLRPQERRAMRSRLRAGEHLPHPRISQRRGREVSVHWGGGAWRLEIDGVKRPPATRTEAAIVPGAYRLLL